MNKLLFVLALSFILAASVMAQDFGREDGPHRRRPPMQKIEELEKIKLLEVLNLDEATSAKFFTRRNQNRIKVFDKLDKVDSVRQSIESEIKRGKNKDISRIQKLNGDFCNLSMDVEKERIGFIKSLSDILTPDQIGKYIVFERKFRDEIRDMLMKEKIKRIHGK
jgi:hypothetical protein